MNRLLGSSGDAVSFKGSCTVSPKQAVTSL
jgi:hypothetical protein